MRKRDKLFQRQKKSGKSKDGHLTKQVKHLIQIKIRSAYVNYLQDFLGSAAQNADENPSGFVSKKKLYSQIKNARKDSPGISPLFNKKENTLITENEGKTTLLNVQLTFQSVFSQLSPPPPPPRGLASSVLKKCRNFLKIYLKISNVSTLLCQKLKLMRMDF